MTSVPVNQNTSIPLTRATLTPKIMNASKQRAPECDVSLETSLMKDRRARGGDGMHYADNALVEETGNKLAESITKYAQKSRSSGTWTIAVHQALKELASEHGWTLFPTDAPYKGEYLCDFTLHENGYGCRVACESQWMNWRREHRSELAWAFDKLRGIKSDLKIFVFEGEEDDWKSVQEEYLMSFAQIAEGEAFLSLQWVQDQFRKSYWISPRSGKPDSIEFVAFDDGSENLNLNVLEVYGNNAAVACPKCTNVYLVSKLINQKSGRKCPNCGLSSAFFEGDSVSVKTHDHAQLA